MLFERGSRLIECIEIVAGERDFQRRAVAACAYLDPDASGRTVSACRMSFSISALLATAVAVSMVMEESVRSSDEALPTAENTRVTTAGSWACCRQLSLIAYNKLQSAS